MPSNLHVVTRDDDRRAVDHSAGDWDQGVRPARVPARLGRLRGGAAALPEACRQAAGDPVEGELRGRDEERPWL